MRCNRSKITRRLSLCRLVALRRWVIDQYLHAVRGFTSECDLRAIHTKNLGVAARRGPPRHNPRAWEEPKLHEPTSIFAGQIDAAQNSRVASTQIAQRHPGRRRLVLVATELQYAFSMEKPGLVVKSLGGIIAGLGQTNVVLLTY
jgi:hypothetical protein